MSIYWTLADWTVTVNLPSGKTRRIILFQGVPSYCGVPSYEGDYLSGWEHDEADEEGRIAMRDVFIVDETTEKRGQKYVKPILRMCIHDYHTSMATKKGRDRLRGRIQRTIERRAREQEKAA